MGEAGKAIFLSYAREDADAARRIADALRAFDLEIWFDQSELRGGDEWDHQIRSQIRECALFVPIISATTQARGEGYFRREWHLAAERTHDMAAGMPFLVPVVIDATPEKGALVPEEFLRMQWTRIPKGIAGPPFVDRMRKLLVNRAWVAGQTRAPIAPPAPPKKKVPLVALWISLGVVTVAAGVVFFVARREKPAPTPHKPAPVSVAKPAGRVVSEKSIAVIPFTNMSEDKDANAFFADGIHEDILTNLANVSDLKVISRTSVMEYRGTTKKMRQIGEELGVAYILEGSVRRSGNQVRVTGQLIDARTDEHVWSQKYDRDLTNVFAIQSELSTQIVAALKAALTPQEKARLEKIPTSNLAAYDLYLKGLEARRNALGFSTWERAGQAQALFEQAVKSDPQFGAAWHELGATHLGIFYRGDPTPARLAKAKAALDTALRLDPDNPRVLQMIGNYYYDAGDLSRAHDQARLLTERFPNHAVTASLVARLARRDRQWAVALANYRKAYELDPRNESVLANLRDMLLGLRRYDEAEVIAREHLAVAPPSIVLSFAAAMIPFRARGSTEKVDALVAQMTPEARRSDPETIHVLAGWALTRGDTREIIRLWEETGTNFGLRAGFGLWAVGTALTVEGQPERAKKVFEQNRSQLMQALAEKPEGTADLWANLALTCAALGDRAGAVEARQKSENMISPTFANLDSAVDAGTGEKDRALKKFEEGLHAPFNPFTLANVYTARRSLYFRPLQDDPRFLALLNDPKNNQPTPLQ